MTTEERVQMVTEIQEKDKDFLKDYELSVMSDIDVMRLYEEWKKLKGGE